MPRRHHAAHRRHHPVPVAQQVEGDDGRDEHQREQVEDDEAGLDDVGERGADIAQRLLGEARGQALDRSALDDVLALQPLDQLQQAAAQLVEVARQLGAEPYRLLDRDRQQHEDEQGQQREEQRGDQQRRRAAPEAVALEPIRQRIEQIGRGHADDEGQQDAAQEVQRQQDGGARQRPSRRHPPAHAHPFPLRPTLAPALPN